MQTMKNAMKCASGFSQRETALLLAVFLRQAMQRELAFLELASRIRRRLAEQRLAAQQLQSREKMLLERLVSWKRNASQ